MNTARRHLPSSQGLMALEALERLESVTAAAQELSLTQSAVSRQLQALEASLGVALFVRAKKRVSLTAAGKRYAEDVRKALHLLTGAALRLQTNPEGGTLNLAILPTFGMRWLVPRLPRFSQAHPDVTVNMNTKLSKFNFDGEAFDAAIHYGIDDWPDTRAMQLEKETVLPVASEAFLKISQTREPEQLLKLPLLHIQTRPDAWRDWFEQHGIEAKALAGTRYDQFSTILQAARHGLGIALLPEYLAREEIAQGRLKAACGPASPSRGSYYLVWPNDRDTAPALVAFRDWLRQDISAEDYLPR